VLAADTELEDVLILTEEYPPYNYAGKNREVKGIAVELLIKAYANAGITLKSTSIKMQPWPRSYRQTQKGSNILLFSMTRTPQRESLFKWVGPISATKIVLIAKKSSNIRITDTEQLSQYFIGGILDDIGIQLVRKLVEFDANVLTTPYAKSLAKMLERGRIDLWAYEENSAKLFFERNNMNVDDYETVYVLSEAELFYAFSLKTDQKIIDRLQKALDEVKNDH
jgi:ABC-type amino acid transport substrate-binding protein